MPASGSQQTLQLTLSPWVGIQWDLNVIQDINSWCTLFVVIGHLALTAAFSHFVLCDNRLSSTGNGKSGNSCSRSPRCCNKVTELAPGDEVT